MKEYKHITQMVKETPMIIVSKEIRNTLEEIIKLVSDETRGSPYFDAEKFLIEEGIKFSLNGKTFNMRFEESGDLLERFDNVVISLSK